MHGVTVERTPFVAVKRLAKEVLRSIENTSAKSRIWKKSPAALTEEKEKKEDAVVEVIESMDSPGRDPASTPFLRRRRRAPSKRQSNEAATAGASHADLETSGTVPRQRERLTPSPMHTSFSAAGGCSWDGASSPFGESPIRKRKRGTAVWSPELSVRRVSRTYSRTPVRGARRALNLFEDPEDGAAVTDLLEEPLTSKVKGQAKKAMPSKLPDKKRKAAFDEWADKKAAEFDEILQFELTFG